MYGAVSEIPLSQHPTVRNVMRFYSLLKMKLPKTQKSAELITHVLNDIWKMWLKIGIPAFSLQRVENKLETLHKGWRNNLKK